MKERAGPRGGAKRVGARGGALRRVRTEVERVISVCVISVCSVTEESGGARDRSD